MSALSLDEDLQDLGSAEDFLQYFEVPYDQGVVHVNRLHILQRFHDYLAQAHDVLPAADQLRRAAYRKLLARAYQDFVESNALAEKVFRVFHEAAAEGSFVPVEALALRSADSENRG